MERNNVGATAFPPCQETMLRVCMKDTGPTHSSDTKSTEGSGWRKNNLNNFKLIFYQVLT